MSQPWFCPRWATRSRRCGARMTPDGDGGYRCPRCQPLPTLSRKD